MRAKSLLILALSVLVFGAYVFLVETRIDTTDERRARSDKVLDLDLDDVTAVTLVHGGTTIELVREPERGGTDGGPNASGWRLVKPNPARADGLSVDGLIRDLAGLDNERTLEGIDRKGAGLDDPRATVTLAIAKGDIVLTIGSDIPGTDSMLLAVDADVYQVPAQVFERLSKPAGDWRDKALWQARRDTIRSVRLDRGGHIVTIARDGDEFRLIEPIEDRVNQAKVNALLSRLSALRAERFVDDPDEAAAADGSGGILTIDLRDRGGPFVVRLGRLEMATPDPAEESESLPSAATTGLRFANVDGQIVTVSGDWDDFFTDSAEAWRDRRLSQFQVFSIAEATFDDAEGTTRLTRAEGEWRRDGKQIDYATASELLYALAELEATALLDPGSAEVAALGDLTSMPRLKATLADEEGTRDRLTLVSMGDGRWSATVEGRDAVLLLDAEAVDAMHAKLENLRQADVSTESDQP